MPDNEIYKFLKENNLTQLDEKAFINKYSAPDKAKEIHSFFVENNLTKLDSAGFYDKYLKKKASGVASVPTESKSQLPSYLEQGKKMAQTGFATPQIVSEDVKTRKEPKIRISPKLFGTPGVVDVDIVEEDEDGSYKNLAQNLINNFLISASDIGAGLAQILRDGAPTGVPREKKKTEELYTEEGKKTPYAKTVTWAQDPLAKVALGLNGISEPIKELQQTPSAKLPDTFVGNTLTSLSAIVPDLAATALLPEAKAIQGASFLQKTGSLLFNNFTKYLMVKEPLVGYNEAKMKGEDQSAIQVLGNVGKGAVSGMELALLGAGSSLATKGIMNQAKKVGLVGTKGFVAKELANLATDVVAYGLISPSISTLYEEGRLPNSKEISEGAGIALAFRLKDAIPSIRTFRDLNKAVDDIQQAKQGAALYNFLQATPESIVRVYNGKESANELHLKAMVAAKEAKDAVDPVEKQKAVIQASTMAKAANVKQMTDMFVQDKGLADYIQNNESLPMEARLAIAEKANLIRKSVDPIEIKKEQTGQRMQQGQRLIQDLTLEMNGEQDPVKKAELQFRINQTEKGLKMQENELMSLIEGQAKEAPLDLTDINTVKQSKKSFNEQIDLKLEALDKNDPDYFEKVEGLNKQREERNDYFDRVLEDKKQEEKGISVMTPEEFNQVENVEVSLEGQKAETPVEEIVTEVKPAEEKKLGKSLIAEEPPLAEGVTIATETGLTEEQRLNKISERQKETSVTDKVNAQNALVQETKLFYEKNKRQRNSSEGLRKLNELRIKARELGLEIDDRSESVVRKTGSRKTKIKYNAKADGDSVIDKSGKTLYERDSELQKIFKTLNDNQVFLDFKTDLGVRASDAQLDATIQDILDGIPSKRANRYLNEVQKAIDNDAFGLKDMGNNALTLEQIMQTERDINKIEKEVVGEPMDEKALEDWLNDQSNLTPKEEAIMIDDFENLLNEYEYENETRSEGEVPAVKPAAEERVVAETKPTEVDKKTTKTTVIEAKKELTLQDIYETLPKSEKLRNEQVKEMVDKNFNSIVKQLEKYKIC